MLISPKIMQLNGTSCTSCPSNRQHSDIADWSTWGKIIRTVIIVSHICTF